MFGLPTVLSVAAQTLLLLPCVLGKYVDESTVIRSSERWLSLPPTPKLPTYKNGKYANVNNIKLWYETFGPAKSDHPPIVFLHGGLANSDYFAHQIKFFLEKGGYQLVSVDSRGHGRSTTDFSVPISYDLMTSDVIALLDLLKIPKASFVGWSDGGILCIDIAHKHPTRLDKAFAFAANYNISGVMDISTSKVFTTYINRTVAEYGRLNPHPDRYDDFYNQVSNMWATQPNWTESYFSTIDSTKMWIADADHEEAVYRWQQDDMARWLPKGGQVLIPKTSHFAFIQAPNLFNSLLWALLGPPEEAF
ncbi:hypothetical protein FRB90_008572 [Tulasnella sp. 427]|nr:hypothetical protein FRB90_008572 [Tulasnella sp. 427]